MSKEIFEQKESYETAMGEMFKKIPKNDGIKLTSSEKKSKINYKYWESLFTFFQIPSTPNICN